MDYKNLKDEFKQVFKSEATNLFFAPGRINLIGEHTDYNGGYVLPCAITFGTYALCKKREDKLIRVYSINFKQLGIIEIDLNKLHYNQEDNWANYPKGMLTYIIESGHMLDTGLDILFYGNIPSGAGLSSSASIEILTGFLIKNMYSLNLTNFDIVKIGKRVENEFFGLNSGIMDQFAIGMGKKGHAILLNCKTLEYKYAPIKLDNCSIVIMNTNKRRELVDSKYNERSSECKQALLELQTGLNIETLSDLTEDTFNEYKHLIKSEIRQKRVKHVVSENKRTLSTLKFLEEGELQSAGKLINGSHISLRDDYNVTGIELDTLVEEAWKQKGVIGARMVGAGFGGCAIAIVQNDTIDSFIENIGNLYKSKIGYDADFYIANIGDGPTEIMMEG